MAQAITNTLKSTNPFAGLLGLNPQPKAPSSVFGSMQTSSPSAIQAKPQTPAWTPSPINFNVATKQPFNTPAVPQQQQSTPVKQATSQPLAAVPSSVGLANPNASFQGINSGPAGTPQSSSKGLFPSVASSLAQKGYEVNPITQDAYGRAQDITKQLKDTRDYEATALGQQGLAPIPMGDITGRQAVIRQQYETRQANLAQQLAAQSQLATVGNTVQSTQQSALQSAGNLTAPQVTSYGQTSFNPETSSFSGGGSLPPEVMQQYAQMAASGQYAGIPSFITSNPVLNAQLNVAAKSLNPKYTPVGAQGASGVLQGIPALQSANTAAEGIKNTINSYLAANPQLNPSDLAAGNILQQWIQGKQLTDPKYQTLFNYLDEYTNTLAPILGVGGDATNLKTQIAQGFVNSAASGQSITQVLNAMSSLATNKIQDIQSGAVGGGTAVPNTQGGAGGGFAETW